MQMFILEKNNDIPEEYISKHISLLSYQPGPC